MKTASALLVVALALAGPCLVAAAASAAAPDAAALEAALLAAGPDAALGFHTLPPANLSFIVAADKVTLAPLPVVNSTSNEAARSVFTYWATDALFAWKLTLYRTFNFTGAHLHLNTLPAEGPIIQHLVPETSLQGDFIPPIDIPGVRLFTGTFNAGPGSELRRTLNVTSIRQFLIDYVARNRIYVNVHGPGTVPIARGFLNV